MSALAGEIEIPISVLDFWPALGPLTLPGHDQEGPLEMQCPNDDCPDIDADMGNECQLPRVYRRGWLGFEGDRCSSCGALAEAE